VFLQRLGGLHVRCDDGKRPVVVQGSAHERQWQTVADKPGPGDEAPFAGQHGLEEAGRAGRFVLS
jgi:hypothetical protein